MLLTVSNQHSEGKGKTMTRLQDIKLGVYEKAIPLQLSWPEKFRVAKDAGYDFIEVSIDGLQPRVDRLRWTDEELREIRHAAENAGMNFYTMALTANRFFPLGDDRDEVRETGKAIVRRAVDIAAFLGIKIIQLAPYDVNGRESNENTMRNFKTSLNEVVAYAAEHGIVLALEVMEDIPFITTVKAAREFVDEMDSPYLQIYTDFGNVAATGRDPAPDLKNGGNHIVATHVKDGTYRNGVGCCRNVPFGEGDVDFEACFQAYVDMNYHGLFITEMWSEENEEFIPYLKEVVKFVREKTRIVDERNQKLSDDRK